MNVKAVVGLASALSLAAGAAAGYFIAKKRLEAKFEARLEQEIAEARAYFNQAFKGASPSEVLQKRRPGLTVPDGIDSDEEEIRAQRAGASKVAEFVETIRANRYGSPSTQITTHNPNRPHIISREEFLGNETDYHQVTYTWYEADTTLADEAEEIVDVGIIGLDNLKFGELSDDPKVVYIRNDNLGLEAEVLHHGGSYRDEVADLGDEDEKAI